MGFSRQEYWSGLSFSLPGDLPYPGIEAPFPAIPALAGGMFITEPSGKTSVYHYALEFLLLLCARALNHPSNLKVIIGKHRQFLIACITLMGCNWYDYLLLLAGGQYLLILLTADFH